MIRLIFASRKTDSVRSYQFNELLSCTVRFSLKYPSLPHSFLVQWMVCKRRLISARNAKEKKKNVIFTVKVLDVPDGTVVFSCSSMFMTIPNTVC